MTTAEICEQQTDIIKAQADIIDELFLLLLQHVNVDDIDIACLNNISNVAKASEKIK